MSPAAVLAVALGLAWPQVAWSTCDVCTVRYEHIKDFSTPFEEGKQYPTCKYYQDAACCSQETVQQISNGYNIYDDASSKSNINACNTDDPSLPAVSDACKGFLEAEYCFYECDVNIGKYRKHADCEYNATSGESDTGWEIFKMPIKAQYCNQWFEACKDDYYCHNSTSGDNDWFTQSLVHAQGACTQASGNCKTYAQVFGAANNVTKGGKAMCEQLWGDAFIYAEGNKSGYVMNFTGPNPNDDLYPEIALPEPCPDHAVTEQQLQAACPATEQFAEVEVTPCELCHLRNDHTADVAIPRPALEGRCAKYADNACCTAKTATAVDTSEDLYNAAFRWDKCYQYNDTLRAARNADPELSAAYERCNAWFREEECLYECDVNAGKWRKHGDCKDDSGGSNGWQMEGMPIRASECDAFYAACRDLVMCACSGPDCPADGGPKSLFGLAFDDDRYCKNADNFCQKTVGEIWTDSKEWCELLWDGAFVYERHEAKAYSFAWNASSLETDDWSPQMHADNPNNRVFANRAWPEPCPDQGGNVEMCDAAGNTVMVNGTASPAPAAAAGGAAMVEGAVPAEGAAADEDAALVVPTTSAAAGIAAGLTAAVLPLLAAWFAV
eukprot:jgi/Ulvmu1/8038/UM004_0275.1